MPTINFSNGMTVNVDGTPTPQDIEEISSKIGVGNNNVGSPTINQSQDNGLLSKASNVANSFLGGLYKYSGMKSAVDLVGTAGEGLAYGVNKLMGNNTQANDILNNPTFDPMKTAATQGTEAGIKSVAGDTLDTAASVAPFAEGLGAAVKAPQAISDLAEKFPNIARYAGYAGQGAGYGGAFAAGQSLQNNNDLSGVVGDTLKGAATGALTGVAIPAAIEGTVRGVKNVASLYSGVPTDAIQNAFNNPEAVSAAIKKYSQSPEQVTGILDEANKSFSAIKQARSQSYQSALSDIASKYPDNTATAQGVQSAINDVLDKYNITPAADGSGLDFSKSPLTEGQQSKVARMFNRINGWEDFSPLGVNNLKQVVSSYRGSYDQRSLNSLIDTVSKNISGLNDNIPEVQSMNKNYQNSTQFINNLQKEIFGSKNMSDSTKLNRLLNIFNQKSPIKEQLVSQLGQQGGQDLLNEITGAALSHWMPQNWIQRFLLEGLGAGGAMFGAHIPGAAATMLMSSPKLVGKVATLAGQVNDQYQKVAPAVNRLWIPGITKALNQK